MDGRIRIWLIGVFFLLAGLYFSRPLFQHMGDALPYGTTPDVAYGIDAGKLDVRPSDIHQVLFYQWLFVDNIRHARTPFANTYEFGPLNEKGLHWLGVWGFPMQLVYALFFWISPVVALNLVVLATFPITGLVHYALLRVCAVRPLFSFLGACIFTFALARRVQLFCGHMNGALYFLLSLSVLLYLLAMQRRSWKWSAAAAGSVVLWALGEWHMFYFSSLFFPLIVVVVLVARMLGEQRSERVRSLLLSAPLLLGVVAGGGYLLWYRAQVIVGSTAEHRSWGELAAHSPDPKYLLDDTRHLTGPVNLGAEVESAIAVDRSALISLAAAVLLLVALKLTRASRGQETAAVGGTPQLRLQRALLWTLTIAGLVFALLSTGSHGSKWLGLYAVLHKYLPHFAIIRVPGRMIYIVYFCLAVCLPIALEQLWAAVERGRYERVRVARYVGIALVAGLCAVPLVQAPGVLLSGVLSKRDLAPLRDPQHKRGAVLLLPIHGANASMSSLAEHFIVATRRRTLNGYAPNAPSGASKLLKELQSLHGGKLSRALHEQLWQLGVRDVVHLKRVSFQRVPNTKAKYLDRLVARNILKWVSENDGFVRYALVEPGTHAR
jgi:hypothetical protein